MYIRHTDSTNRLLKDMIASTETPAEALCDGFYIVTDYQTAGRGQVGNHWESKDGENLLVSILIRPQGLEVSKQFRLSMIASLSVVGALNSTLLPYTGVAGATSTPLPLTIKWPNDIYYKEKKLGGILIENRLNGKEVSDCIFGLGLNINQTVFESDAPNPISLKQITGKEADKQAVLEAILTRLNQLKTWLSDEHYEELKEKYIGYLFRKEGEFEYEDERGRFKARFKDIDEMGRLVVVTETGEERAYLFKQIKYIIKY
ncbi:MAG: biotin--[acetyl-CoA-carboxylase] ligase [Paludibacteraceae bacterium]|nr:biotin--[acetyl-CoA-carboxylase] ligase [Paludibacteraceae bacterium]